MQGNKKRGTAAAKVSVGPGRVAKRLEAVTVDIEEGKLVVNAVGRSDDIMKKIMEGIADPPAKRLA